MKAIGVKIVAMKVKNLIDRLQAYPEDMEVFVLDAN